MKKTINVGLIGMGTVGTGVVKILTKHQRAILSETGIEFRIKSVCVKNPRKKRGVSLRGVTVTRKPGVILNDPKIDQVVELMGGLNPADRIIEHALYSGKDVISANKALFAERGEKLYRASQSTGHHLGFEAAVCSGVPVIQGLREGLAANEIDHIVGILNGTCNYILTQMSRTHETYKESLASAQKRGYAEKDPKMDVDGTDTAHKLAILARLAFRQEIDFSKIHCEGISHITPEDIEYAMELGYQIKLLAIAKREDRGSVELRVHPALLESYHPLANVNGVNNAVMVSGDAVGNVLFYGKGAGQMPTASAVVSDMIRIASSSDAGLSSGEKIFPRAKMRTLDDIRSRYYLRFQVVDRPAVMGALTKMLGDHQISLSSVRQKEIFKGPVPIIILTHEAPEKRLQQAIQKISRLSIVKAKPVVIRIEESEDQAG